MVDRTTDSAFLVEQVSDLYTHVSELFNLYCEHAIMKELICSDSGWMLGTGPGGGIGYSKISQISKERSKLVQGQYLQLLICICKCSQRLANNDNDIALAFRFPSGLSSWHIQKALKLQQRLHDTTTEVVAPDTTRVVAMIHSEINGSGSSGSRR